MLSCPDYMCTWDLQGHLIEPEKQRLGLQQVDVHDVLNHESLFGENGICSTFYPEIRSRLIFLLDDGWDIPFSEEGAVEARPFYTCHNLCEKKFPGYGTTPQERLKTLAENIQKAGWKAAGLWIAAQETLEFQKEHGDFDEEFWKERILWSRYAGIAYWKIDWGNHFYSEKWRRFISRTKEDLYPELIIEHITSCTGLNDSKKTGRVLPEYIEDNIRFGSFSDVFRTYDVTVQLSKATTFDRIAEHLYNGYTEEGPALGLLNGEDEAYMCASLGLTIGVMRAGCTSQKLDEIVRAIRWHEIAPAYEVGLYDTQLSNEFLADDWDFQPGDSWDATADGIISQRAPATVARGCELPTVIAVGNQEKPFVSACRYPNGAFSIGSFGRTHGRTPYTPIAAAVDVTVGELTGPIGVFGTFQSLMLRFDRDLSGLSIMAGDLMTGNLIDIKDKVRIDKNTLLLSGDVISSVGLIDAHAEDQSEPGLLLKIGSVQMDTHNPAERDRLSVWAIRNGSFEKDQADPDGDGYSKTAAQPRAWLWKGDVTIAKNGHTGNYACIHSADDAFEMKTWQEKRFIPNGVYTLTAWVQVSPIMRKDGFAIMEAFGNGVEARQVKMDTPENNTGSNGWRKIAIKDIVVTGGELIVQFSTKAGAGDFMKFDDVSLEYQEL